MPKECCDRPDQKRVHCINVHVNAETEQVLKQRMLTAAEMLKNWAESGKLDAAMPEGIVMWPNHGSGGGP